MRVKKILKGFAIFFLCMSALFFLAVSVLYFSFSATDVRDWLQRTIAEQTGGKCEIESLELSVWQGVKIRGFNLYPPAAGDLRGYLNGGEVAGKHLLKVSSFEFGFETLKLLVGSVHVSAVLFSKPELMIEKNGSDFNFTSILAYREKHFPASPAPPTEEPSEPKAPLKLDELMPSWLRLVFIPLHIKLENIGFEDLQLEFRETSDQHDRTIFLKGLDVGLLLSAFANQTRASVTIRGHDERELAFSMETYEKQGAKASHLMQAEIGLYTELFVEDLHEIGFDFDLAVKRLLVDQETFRDLPANMKMRLNVQSNLAGIEMDAFKVKLLDTLVYDLKGDVGFPKNNFDVIRLKIHQNLEIALEKLNPILQQKLPGNSLTGKVKLSRFSIEGDIEPEKLSKEHLDLPSISTILSLENINADLSQLGLVASDINANFSLAAGRSMVGEGSQLDGVFDFGFSSIFYQMVGKDNETVSVMVRDFVTKLVTRVHYPKPEMPFLKFSAHAQQIVGSGANIETIDVPFDLEMDADFRENFDKASFSLRTQLAKLLSLNVFASCKQSCSFAKMDAWFELDSFQKLFQFSRPILQKFVSLKFIPDKMEGSLLSKLNFEAEIPPPLTTPWQTILKTGKANYSFEFNVNDVQVEKQPFVLEGFSNRLRLDGDFTKQKLFFKQLFEQVKFALPPKPGEPAQLAEVQNYKFETTLENELQGELDLKKPLAKMRQVLGAKLYLGLIDMADRLPTPLSGLQLSLDASLDKMATVSLDQLKLVVPDMGMKTTLVASSGLKPNLQPKNLSAQLKVLVDQKETKSLISNIKTTGSLSCTVDAKADDLKLLTLNGAIGFDHFFLMLPNPKEIATPLLVVEDMNGEIPLKQNINLEPFFAAEKEEAAQEDQDGETVELDDESKTYAISKEEFEDVSKDYFKRNRDTISENTNRIALVDYPNVRPFFPGRHPLAISRIKTASLEFKSMEFDVELKQHWFALNQYIIDFLGGKIQGDVQFAFDPKPHALRASIHLTQLDTRKLLEGFPKLKSKAKSWSLLSNPYLDGNFHIDYDLLTGTIDGGIEITSIGQEQLKMILYYLDPKEEQATISQIRMALNFGEIRHVSIPIKNGLIGLKVDVRILAAPIPTPELRGFPIAQLVQNFREQSKTTQEEMPEAEAEAEATGAEDGPPAPEGNSPNGESSDVPIVH